MPQRGVPLTLLAPVLLAGCGGVDAEAHNPETFSAETFDADKPVQVRAQQKSGSEKRTGTPAMPMGDQPLSPTNQVISKEELAARFPRYGEEQGCVIDFAYRGYEPEVLIRRGEPCDKVSVFFADRALLEKYNDWERLDSYQQADVLKGPDSKVLYVEGQFTASVYPIGITGLTYSVVVTD
ncbi:MAG: hypothetical protein SXU28_05320 [Pseudomonadota bacterium]|nr:hypothetical protein [Pseudomonadota bacterium]